MNTLSDMPPLSRAALLLDLDGTLLDIAPTPEEVVVGPGLVDDLAVLRRVCGDALAVVTGRPIAQVDRLLGAVPFAVAGEHGTSIRHAPEAVTEHIELPPIPSSWCSRAESLAAAHPRSFLEQKSHGLVLHYRAVPDAGPALRAGLEDLLGEHPASHVLMAAKMAWELRPTGADKGTAVRALMKHAPFAGRIPVFIGDDVTDEDGMNAARDLGGIGLRVPEVFGDAVGVRSWIARLASNAPRIRTSGEP